MSFPFIMHCSLRETLAWLAGLSLLALAVAWASQYGLGLRPCELCLWQRYPYMAVILLCAWGYMRPNRASLALATATLLLLGETALALYHTGVEQGLFNGPDACAAGNVAGKSLEELRAQILGRQLVMCNQPAILFLGLSMATWNAVLAAIMTGVGVSALWQNRKGQSHG